MAKSNKRNPQDATMRNVKGKATKKELAAIKSKLPATIHEAVNDLDRRVGKQVDEIRQRTSEHHDSLSQAYKIIAVAGDRITALESAIKQLTADKGLGGRVKTLEDRLYVVEGKLPADGKAK
jgi:hypothetical protein